MPEAASYSLFGANSPGGVSPASPIALGLVGVGKIALDQHVPALRQNPHFTLVASSSHQGHVRGLPAYPDIESMLAGGDAIEAISICTPPSVRYAIACKAIAAGLHVMLEKPPGTTVAEVVDLTERAAAAGVSLFTAWHSREASGVDAARIWLRERKVRSVRIDWREDIRRWHPGQEWILATGGFGVFDPAINALSIATAILPGGLVVRSAELCVPRNREAPIAATMSLIHAGSAPVSVDLNFLEQGPQRWDIEIQTDDGMIMLCDGGRTLLIDGKPISDGLDEEYCRLYRRFAALIDARRSDVDWRPIQLVADAFLVGTRKTAEAFDF